MMIEALARKLFTGIAKPKQLKVDLTGFWSRRIDDVNRLVYQVTEQELRIRHVGITMVEMLFCKTLT